MEKRVIQALSKCSIRGLDRPCEGCIFRPLGKDYCMQSLIYNAYLLLSKTMSERDELDEENSKYIELLEEADMRSEKAFIRGMECFRAALMDILEVESESAIDYKFISDISFDLINEMRIQGGV